MNMHAQSADLSPLRGRAADAAGPFPGLFRGRSRPAEGRKLV